MYVSLDADEESWRKAIEKYEIKGVHLHCLDDIAKMEGEWSEIEFAKKYDIQGIPHYFIIDKEGNFVDSNAPRPSDPRIVEKLQSLVKK